MESATNVASVEPSIGIREEQLTVDGEAIVIRVLNLGQGDCMTVADVAEMFGITAAGLRSILRDQKARGSDLCVRPAHAQDLELLKAQGVLPLMAREANFLPKDTIRDLAKVINTPQAWAAYRQVWADSEQLRTSVDSLVVASLQADVADIKEAMITSAECHRKSAQGQTQLAQLVSLCVSEIEQLKTLRPSSRRPGPVIHPDYPRLDDKLIRKLQNAIATRVRRLGYTGDQAYSRRCYLMGDLKRALLPAGTASELTFKHIKPEQVPAALQFIANWQ